jgi:acetyl-CoA carboxylase carboxyl transferase subunit beta
MRWFTRTAAVTPGGEPTEARGAAPTTAGDATPPLLCPDCGVDVAEDEGFAATGICSACGHREALSARQWIELLFDADSFDERFSGIGSPDPLQFTDSRSYPDRLKDARRRSGESGAVLTGTADIRGRRVVAAVSDFRFIGGSMGYAVGERVAEAMRRALEARLPFIAVTCSGGARMQEGMVALLQMAKTAAAAQRLHEAGLPILTVLADPTTGGVYASYASQGDVVIAERGAMIGFAGPRVRAVADPGEEREALHAEDLLAAGQVDAVSPRELLRELLERLVALLQPSPPPDRERLPPPAEVRGQLGGWRAVERARHHQRPTALDYLSRLAGDFVELHGDRSGVDDPALVGGLARLAETNVVVIAQERGDRQSGGERCDGRVSAAGYRKARRLMLLAERLQLPLVTLIDTPGAHDGLADDAQGVATAISDCLATMASLTTPTVALVIGEGGSGGALALTVGDRVLMQQNAIFAITSPEGAAAILYRDRSRAPERAEALGVSAGDLLALGAVDEIVPEPAGGAHADPEGAARLLGESLARALAEAMSGRGIHRRRRREARLRRIGRPSRSVLGRAAGLLGAPFSALGGRIARGIGVAGDGESADRSQAETPAGD